MTPASLRLESDHAGRLALPGWDTMTDLDKDALEARLGPPDLDGLEVLAMDELAIQKGDQLEVHSHCPNAEIVFDLFHVVANKRLAIHAHAIVAHARWPLHTSLLGGINNKLKVIKRMADGLRDDTCSS